MPSSIPFTTSRTRPRVADGYLDLRSLDWQSQKEEDGEGEVTISGFGAGISLKGNRWICADLTGIIDDITPTTILEFEFYSGNSPAPADYDPERGGQFREPDICAIGLGDNESIVFEEPGFGTPTQQFIFQVYGTLLWERAFYCGLFGAGEVRFPRQNSYRNIEPVDLGSRWEKYEVCLGSISQDVSRNPKFLYLIARHIRQEKSDIRFRNIRFYDDPTIRRFPEKALSHYDQDSPLSVYEQQYSGVGAKISRNAWKAVELNPPVEVTSNTYFDCWVRAEVEGEWAGLGMIPEDAEGLDFDSNQLDDDQFNIPLYTLVAEYSIILSGKQYLADYEVSEPFPYGYRDWVHIRLFLDKTKCVGKVCKYLVIFSDDDTPPREGTFEIMLLRFKELEDGKFPYIGTERKFVSSKGLSIENNKLRGWSNVAGERFELSSRGSSAEHPDVDILSSNTDNFILSTRKVPTITGAGGRMQSRGNLLNLNQRFYAFWIVCTIPFFDGGSGGQTIFELKSRNQREGIKLSVYAGGGFSMLLDFVHTTTAQGGETFTLRNDVTKYATGEQNVICIYKEAGVDPDYLGSEGEGNLAIETFVPRVQYFVRINNDLLPYKQSFAIDSQADSFQSPNFYYSLFGAYDGSEPFLGEMLAFVNTQRRNDICNIRGVNKRLMSYYGIYS